MGKRPSPPEHEQHSLKGAFVASLILGGFIAVSWLGAFFVFISRG